MVRFDFEEIVLKWMLQVGGIVGLVSWGLTQLIKQIPGVNIALATIDIRGAVQAGISTDLAQKLVSFINGTADIPTVALIIIAGMVLVGVGRIISLAWLPGRTSFQRLWFILFAGSMAGALLINWGAGFGLDQIWTYITMAIYSGILALVVYNLYDWLNLRLPAM